MIVDARDGKTARGFRPYTTSGTMAFVLDRMKPGDEVIIEKFMRLDGVQEPASILRANVGKVKADGEVYTTRAMKDGLHIWRVS